MCTIHRKEWFQTHEDIQPYMLNKVPIKTKGKTVFHLADWQRTVWKSVMMTKLWKSRNSFTLLVEKCPPFTMLCHFIVWYYLITYISFDLVLLPLGISYGYIYVKPYLYGKFRALFEIIKDWEHPKCINR